MKPSYKRYAIYGLMLASMTAFAAAVEPIITYDVHVVKNATADQCPASWEGDIAPDTAVDETGGGSETILTAPGVRSCTDCSIDKASKDCVCKTCYDDYNM